MQNTEVHKLIKELPGGDMIARWVDNAIGDIHHHKLYGEPFNPFSDEQFNDRNAFANKVSGRIASDHVMESRLLPTSETEVRNLVNSLAANHQTSTPLVHMDGIEFAEHFEKHGVPIMKTFGSAPIAPAAVPHISGAASTDLEGWLKDAIMAKGAIEASAISQAHELHQAIHANNAAHGFPIPASKEEAGKVIDAINAHLDHHYPHGNNLPNMQEAHHEVMAVQQEMQSALDAIATGNANMQKIWAEKAAAEAAKKAAKQAAKELRGQKFAAFFKGEGSEIVGAAKGFAKASGTMGKVAIGATAAVGALTILPALVRSNAARETANQIAAADAMAFNTDAQTSVGAIAPLTQEQAAWVRRVATQDPLAPEMPSINL